MPFIDPQDRTEPVELKLKIRPEVVTALNEYAAFLKSEKSYVVQQILRKVIAADKDFQSARKQQNAVPEASVEDSKKGKAVA